MAPNSRKNDRVLQLVAESVRGSRRAQNELFAAYRGRVWSLTYKSLGPDFDIEDTVQKVFVNLFKSLPAFKGLSSFDTWVYRICVKVCTDRLRGKYRKSRLRVVRSPDNGGEEFYGAVESTPGSELERRELEAEIFKALDKLSEQKRMAVVLYEMEGLSMEEIADVMGTPTGTVKSRLFHARNQLRKLLRKHLREQ